MPLLKVVETDTTGKVDFGFIKTGHYTLVIEEPHWGSSDWFDVEVTELPRLTESVTIDVSPNFPNCKGGHEFIARAQ